MSNVVNKNTMQFILSANTPDYSVEDWIHDPESLITLLNSGVPNYFWKLSNNGTDITEMNQNEKNIVIATKLLEEDNHKLQILDSRDILGAILRVLLDEINLLRSALGLQARNLTQFKNATRNKLESL